MTVHSEPVPSRSMSAAARRRNIGFQLGTFAGVGALATGAHYLVLIALVQLCGYSAWLGSAIGCLVGAAINYILNRRVTFRSGVPHARSLPKFAVVAALGMAINALIVAGLVAVHVHYLAAQIVATGTVLGWNFVLNRSWTFRQRS